MDIPSVIEVIWTAIGGTALTWLLAFVTKWFSAETSSKWVKLVKTIVADVVDELDQAIEAGGGPTKARAKELAVESAVAALKAAKVPKKIIGDDVKVFAATKVEAAVNQKRALAKAVEAGSVTVGPR